jgi:hypothetical protein
VELLKSETNSFNVNNCIKMRLGEKRIMQFYINFVDYCLPLFEMTEDVKFIFLMLSKLGIS